MAEKRDCSNIFVFMEEWERRRIWAEKTDNNLKYREIGEINPFATDCRGETLQIIVSDLQKWVDKHPRQTRREKFIQMCLENGFERVADNKISCLIFKTYLPCLSNDCEECKEYWDSEAD